MEVEEEAVSPTRVWGFAFQVCLDRGNRFWEVWVNEQFDFAYSVGSSDGGVVCVSGVFGRLFLGFAPKVIEVDWIGGSIEAPHPVS
jgi:hypothetical protein